VLLPVTLLLATGLAGWLLARTIASRRAYGS
jgi:hypothetical protein